MSSRTRYWLCTKCKEIVTVTDPDPKGKAIPSDEIRCSKTRAYSYCKFIELVPKEASK